MHLENASTHSTQCTTRDSKVKQKFERGDFIRSPGREACKQHVSMYVYRLKIYPPVTECCSLSANIKHRMANIDVSRRTSLRILLQGLRRIYHH